MTCSVDNQEINVNTSPLNPVPGFGVPVSPVQVPLPSFDLPAEMVEDVLGVITALEAIFPSGTFKANYDQNGRTIYSFISDILSQVAPFLSIYNFFMALIKLPPCLIDVLCAIPNPFAMAEKIIVLFTQCVPPFLRMLPPLALLVMIISILLLLLKLIEYIVNQVIEIITQILNNLTLFANGIAYQDAESVLAVAKKIAALLCQINNILAILQSLNVIFQIIETLAKVAVPLLCDSDDANGCCSTGLCPDFIKKTPDGIQVTSGKLIYTKQIGVDVESVFSLPPELASIISIPALRVESWQIYDQGTSTYPINLIVTPVAPLNNIFYPEEVTFTKDTPPKRAPYTVDVEVTLNPSDFGISDGYGPRTFLIKDCIVTSKPYQGYYNYQNILVDAGEGTLSIQGGLVYLVDGTPYLIGGIQATLNDFIHLEPSTGTALPGSDDTITFDVRFIWKPNAPALVGFNLTTLGCIPEVSVQKEAINAVTIAEGNAPLDIRLPKVNSTSFLPNLSGTLTCISKALAIYRTNITPETTATFQSTVLDCLSSLQDETSAALCNSLNASVSIFQTSVVLSPELQFTSRPITVTVTLKDASGTPVASGITDTCATQLANSLSGSTTFGKLSEFVYDGTGTFKATLTSASAGAGTLQIFFNGDVLSTFATGVITENSYPFTFIDAGASPAVRRDASDVSNA